MKTIYNHIKTELEKNERGRERRNRDHFLTNLILEKHGKHAMFVDINFLPEFATEYESYSRIWRKVLQDNEHLRGDDYHDGEKLSQQVQIDLDYQAGYKQMVK